MKYTIVNRDFVPADKASVLITDLAIQRGYGIFDFFKTIDNKPVFLEWHLDRFFNSAGEMRLDPDISRSELTEMLFHLIEKNDIPKSGIRITLTGGYSPDGYSIASPNMIITQSPIEIAEDISGSGIKLITHEHRRQLPQVKSLDYMMAVWLQPVIKSKMADDVLYYSNGLVGECPRANIFIVDNDNRILTPKKNILKGVIRKNVLELAGNGFEILESDVTVNDLHNCKEAFITSSTKNIMPVLEIDGKSVGNGKAGEVTMQLSDALKIKITENIQTLTH